MIASLIFLTAGRAPAVAGDWHQELATTRPEFSQVPFWFWNDRLDENEIKRQMADFRDHGVYGFIIHARMGLPKDIPYMGERWLHLVRAAVEEAARTDMRVCLYDEGMYPSGSAHGAVVRSNPAFAARGLMMTSQDVTGPTDLPRPAVKDGNLVATVLAKPASDPNGKALEPGSLQLVNPAASSVKIPEGSWRVLTFACVFSKGRIRGVHEDEEDSSRNAPAAANLLDPAAMKAFIQFAYEPYYQTLKDHFGKTVIAMFTDEPSVLGRRSTSGLQPWTSGIEGDFEKQHGYSILPRLPALFLDAGPKTAAVRADFRQTLAKRLNESYYRQLSDWCVHYGIALTGHPAASDEIDPLRYFQIPGQDTVWRWLLPEKDLALRGANSTVAKCSSSVARHDGRRRNANELYGAFGWQLTMEEMKWLADWHMVRGVNMLYPHAFYYSIRENRFNERPPDVGPNNTWWPYYRLLADYTSRVCALLTDGEQVCDVAILGRNTALPWRAAEWLYRNQIDFNYVEEWRLIEQAKPEAGRLVVGPMRYKVLIVDQNEPPAKAVQAKLEELKAAGVMIRSCAAQPGPDLTEGLPRDITCEPAAPDLRYVRLRKDGREFLLLVNEGEQPIETGLAVRSEGRAEWFDAWENTFRPATIIKAENGVTNVALRLDRRGSLVLCIDPGQPRAEAAVNPPAKRSTTTSPLDGPWRVTDLKDQSVETALGDWHAQPATKGFAGSLRYRTIFKVTRQDGTAYSLDLGGVGDYAVIQLNGQSLPPRFWSPYRWDVTPLIREGPNELTVEVTNSLANRYDRAKARPSGLLGPVELLQTAVDR